MRWRRLRWQGWAAGLGLLALALNALVPVHLAFDLAAALAPARHGHAEIDDAGARRIVALLSLHEDETGESDHHRHHHQNQNHGAACPVCAAFGALAGLAPAAPVALSAPLAIATLPAAPAFAAAPVSVTVAGYRSRAPPLA